MIKKKESDGAIQFVIFLSISKDFVRHMILKVKTRQTGEQPHFFPGGLVEPCYRSQRKNLREPLELQLVPKKKVWMLHHKCKNVPFRRGEILVDLFWLIDDITLTKTSV